jgi:O-antigen/teichoic acid export membrane protein
MGQKLKALLFKNQNTRQTLVKNIVWLTVGQLGGRFLRAGIIIYAARVLGASQYGVFSYVLGLAGFFTVFADVGVTSILTREVAKNPKESGRYFATTFWIKLALLVVTALAIVFIAPRFSNMQAALSLIPFVAILAIADGLREFGVAVFRAKEKMELEALVMVVTNAAIAAAGFIALAYYPTAGGLTVSYVASATAGTLVAVFMLRREFLTVFSSFARELVKPVVAAAVPLAGFSIIGSFMFNVDLIMLGWWRSAADVGFYSAAQRIVQVFYAVPAILASAMFPVISRFAAQRASDKERTLVERGASAMFLIALPLVVGGALLASPLISFMYGSAYASAARVLQILLLTTLAIFPGTLLSNFMLAHNKHFKLAPAVVAASLANVGLNFILIPPLGIIGAAVATVGAHALYNGLVWWYSRRIVDFKVLKHLVRIVVATAVMSAAVTALHAAGAHVLFAIVAGVAVYFVCLYFLRETLLEELFSILRRRTTPVTPE